MSFDNNYVVGSLPSSSLSRSPSTLGGGSDSQHGHVIPDKQDAKPLAYLLACLQPHVAGELPLKLGEGRQGQWVPAPEGVHTKGQEGQALGLAPRGKLGQLLRWACSTE